MYESITTWTQPVFAKFWVQVENKSRTIMFIILGTFVLAVIGLVFAVANFTQSPAPNLIMIPMEHIVKFNDQEYIPVKILR